ncbi:MAG: DMT family transporter [Bryobacterales bacterium]
MTPQPLNRASALLALFVSILWGGNVVALKYGLATFPPFWSALWRMLSACLAVVIWAKLRGIRILPKEGEWGPFMALSAMFTAQISGLNTGTNWTSAAYAVVLLNSHPVFTNLFAHYFDSEDKLTPRRLFGLFLAFAGIVYVATGRPDASLAPHPGWGNSLMIVSANLLAIRVIYTRRLVQSADPERPVIWQMAFSLPVFLAIALVSEPMTLKAVDWKPVAAILYQGVLIAGFCFMVWTTLLRKHSAANLSMFGFSVPVFGVAMSAVVFHEELQLNLLLGVMLVTAGILIVTRKARAAVAAPAPADGARQ